MTTMTTLDLLAKVPSFRELDPDDLATIASATVERTTPVGETLIHQGGTGEGLYVVASGAIRLFKSLENGREVELRVVRPYDFFGEMSLIDGAAQPATAVTQEEAHLLVIRRTPDPDFYIRFLLKSKTLLRSLLRLLANDLRTSNEHRFGLVLQEEKIRAESELERLRSLSQMVAGVAHEINTPLGIIQNAATLVTETLGNGAIEQLARDDDARETLTDIADACKLIERNVTVAARLVTSFKSLSVRQISEASERVDLYKVVDETVGLYRFKARSSKLAFALDCALSPEDRIWNGFPGYLSQILLNFLTNIDRYAYPTGEGGRVEITVRQRSTAGRPFEVTVRDFGRGISEADLPRVFDPFFTTGRGKEGSGLGLAIVHNLVTTGLRGSVSVQSKVGEGAAFTLVFPRDIPEGMPS